MYFFVFCDKHSYWIKYKSQAIPVAIEYDSGIIIIVINAGTATSNFFQFISAKLAIKIPTTTNAGVVTALVTISINGLKNNANRNKFLSRY